MFFADKAMRKVALLAVSLFVCLPPVSPATKYPLSGDAYVCFVTKPFDFPIGTRRVEVLKSLGPPTKERRSTRKNPHDSTVTDVFHDFWYNGLMLRTAWFPAATPPSSALLLVVVTSRKHRLKHQLQVGSPKRDVLRVLGSPESGIKTQRWSYSADTVSLEFTFENNRVSRIRWSSDWD